MARIVLVIFFTLASMESLSQAIDSPVEAVSKFYGSYLAYDYKMTPKVPRPKIALSKDFSAVIANTDAACKKFADYPCGWGADGDEYLDAQEIDPKLSYKNSGISIAESSPGFVSVQLNVYPSLKDAGDFYLRRITYKIINESGRWVVDDVIYSDNKSTKQTLIEEAVEAEKIYKEEHSGLKP